MSTRSSWLSGCILVAFGGMAMAADWPQFRGPGGLGVSADKIPTIWGPQQNIVWKADLPGPGTSSPILLGDRIFLTCYTMAGGVDTLQRHLVCLDRATGRVLWDTPTAAQLPEQMRIREEHGYVSNTPAADAERIYVHYGRSGARAFDHSGKQLWHTDVGDKLNGWGSAASPVLHGDLVIINASVESESLYALDRRTGQVKWRAGRIRESWNTPILVDVGGKKELVVAILGKVLGFDPDSGEALWSCDTGISWYMAPSMVSADGVVYCIGGRTGGALAVRAGGRGNVTGSHRIWTGTRGSNVSSPIIHGGRLYWMHENTGVAYCAEAKTGNILYEQRIGRGEQAYASPVLAGGVLYYLARNGRMAVLAAGDKFEQIALVEPLERGVYNASPAVADGKLYLRIDRRLYCIGQP